MCNVSGYGECHNADEVISKRGYDPEADTANTPDSVFCEHGAGFLVKWNDVEKYMHLPSALEPDKKEEERFIKAAEFVSAAASDEELLRIFEKTYGPIKAKISSDLNKRQKMIPSYRSPNHRLQRLEPGGPLYILVDGYNIIFAWEELKKASEESLDLARELLINRMCNYRGYKNCELILVFDAYKVKGNPGSVEKINNINVVYTKEAETADAYIEKVSHELAKKYRVRVATSDNLEQVIILGNGAARVSAAEFKKEVEDAEKEIREFLKQTF